MVLAAGGGVQSRNGLVILWSIDPLSPFLRSPYEEIDGRRWRTGLREDEVHAVDSKPPHSIPSSVRLEWRGRAF